MADYTLKIRRFDPESGRAGLLGRLRRRPAARALGARRHPPGQGPRGRLDRHPLLLPRRHLRLLRRAHQRQDPRWPATPASATPPRRARDGAITVEPMGNMPVIKDLIVDMDAVHWKKVQRVVPWLLPDEDPPERQEYIVPAEAMIDVTQSMACIQCGVCVGACLSLEVDPEFIGPAALAKAYRFVGDPRDGEHEERLRGPGRGPARHLRLHPLLRLRRGLPQGRGADEPDHAPAPQGHRRLRDQGRATTATATRRRS